jgi:hypothetical protein
MFFLFKIAFQFWTMEKIKKVIKFEDLPPDAMQSLAKRYPDGWKDFVRKITKPNGEFFHAIDIDTENASYLVKVNVKIDSKSDVEKITDSFIDKEAEKEAETDAHEEAPAQESEE